MEYHTICGYDLYELTSVTFLNGKIKILYSMLILINTIVGYMKTQLLHKWK